MAYAHINSNTSVELAKGTVHLSRIVVGTTGSAWTASIYDGVDATGRLVSLLTASDGGNYDYECTLTTGLYVVTAGTTAGDLTVIFD